ncbi:hypothetical protein MA16_Dca020840 [Dendrobium catenatum]|uniref:Uncharacterized protein n=1 Tax=Dendrobium catenatum TaxID=906689 RepID=A0A2I0VYU2_9ASPA|nr:hypothetical protein MA16_Dca020840 [Dendrobium catenatum]
MRPRDLGEAMELAQLVEDQRHLERETGGNNSRGMYKMTTTLLISKEPTPDTLRGTSKEKTAGGRSGDNFKKLTETKLHERGRRDFVLDVMRGVHQGIFVRTELFRFLLFVMKKEMEEGVVFPPCRQGGFLGVEYC